jgi:cysteinyl-tRNA synthetase
VRRVEDFALAMKERSDGSEAGSEFISEVEASRRAFIEAMDDDLNASSGLSVVFDFIRRTYQRNAQSSLSGGDARAALEFIHEIDRVFGVLRSQPGLLDEEILGQIEARHAARRRRDFAEADRIRDWLLTQGIVLEDTRDGTRWKRT